MIPMITSAPAIIMHGQTAQHAETDLDVIVDGKGLGHRLGLRLARDGARRRARDIRCQFAEGHAGLRLRGEGTGEEHDKRQDQRYGPGGETEPAQGRGRGRCRVSHLTSSDCTLTGLACIRGPFLTISEQAGTSFPHVARGHPSCDHSGLRLSRKAATPSAVSRLSMFSTITAPVSS
jgi:hypothetical protein